MTTQTPQRTEPSANVIIGLLVGSAFVMILNETVMSVALPVLITDLNITARTAQWLTSGFLLTMAVVIPMSGSLLQRFPVRTIFVASMTLFCTGTLVAALAPGFAVLLAGRIIQACGTAVMMPLLMTTVMSLIPADRRGQTMGTISIVIAVAPAIGPTMSGLILGSLNWRWMFGIVLPIALAALAAGLRWLKVADERQQPNPIDPVSVPLSAMAFAALSCSRPLFPRCVRRGRRGSSISDASGVRAAAPGMACRSPARQACPARRARTLGIRNLPHRGLGFDADARHSGALSGIEA